MTKPWIPQNPKALVIGHDPRLNRSETIAEYSLFADYYFKPVPGQKSEKRKYDLAYSLFNYISIITNKKLKPEDIAVTNLCNSSLPHAPKGKTVLIPKYEAEQGMNSILEIIDKHPGIEFIFPLSLQVNYWLQKFNFYDSNDDFCANSEPKEIGLNNNPPYFQPKQSRTFLKICGNEYSTSNKKIKLYPILHVKCYPPANRFSAYGECYDKLTAKFL